MTFYSSATTQQEHDFWDTANDVQTTRTLTSALEKHEQANINNFGNVAIPAVAAALSLSRPSEKSRSSITLTNRLLGLDSDDDNIAA